MKKVIKKSEVVSVEDKIIEILKPVDGFYCVYRLGLSYGGSEEGGWWQECGELVAAIPATRDAKHTYLEKIHTTKIEFGDGEMRMQVDGEYCGLTCLEYMSFDKPRYVQDMLDKLVENGVGKFDSEYRSTRPKHESLTCHWQTEIKLSFGAERTQYE